MNQTEALKIMKMGASVFLTGVPGAGKTYILNQYVNFLRRSGIEPAITASTGIAATHIGGATIHSWSGIGIKKSFEEMDIDKLIQNERLYKRYKNTKVLIIDEISMLAASQFEMIDVVSREMKQSAKPFGGMQVILSGDFFQLPPVFKSGDDERYAFESPSWKELSPIICYLKETYRHEDDALKEILNGIRQKNMEEDLRMKLFDKIGERNWEEDEGLKDVTKLYTHNVDVDSENESRLSQIEGQEFTYDMRSRGKKHLVEPLKKGCLAPECLVLKKGAQVMFVKNDGKKRYVNGTRGVVEDFEESVPIVKTLSGEKVLAEYAEWTREEDGKVVAQIEQIPLRLAWAITVHKSQGMTLDEAHINLSKSFVPGQGYVGLSRVRSMSGLYLSGLNEQALAVDERATRADRNFLAYSGAAQKKINAMSDEMVENKVKGFINKNGGKAPKNVHDDGELSAEAGRALQDKSALKENFSTYEKTRKLAEKKMSIEEMAERRELKKTTIIGHLEELKAGALKVDLWYMLPGIMEEIKDFNKIEKAFLEVGEFKLSPVKDYLKEEKKIDATYDELRLVRLMLSDEDFKDLRISSLGNM